MELQLTVGVGDGLGMVGDALSSEIGNSYIEFATTMAY